MRGILAVLAALFLLAPAVPGLAVNIGDRAVPVTGETLSGEPFNLADSIGKKVILLKFGSIYCSTCVSSLEDIARIQRKFRPSDLQVVGINLDVYGIPRVRRFYKGYASLIKYPMLIDERLAAARPYDIQSIPAHVVIDRQGTVQYVSTGATEEDFRIIEEVLGKVIRGEPGIEKLVKQRPLEVFLPLNFTKTLQDSIYVVGKAKPGSRITLALNAGTKQSLTTMRDLFYLRTPLSIGSNYLELSVMDPAGGRVNQGVVIFREPRMGSGVESPFSEYRFHNDRNEAPCRQCHDLTPPKQVSQGVNAATQFCLGCHKELTGQRQVHGPITIGGCSPCHRFESRPNRYEVIAQGQELCFKCHAEKRKDLIRTYLHGPISAGLCTICHSPHGSSEKYQLRKFGGDLCVMCHEKMKEVSFRKVVHKPVNDGACSACHEAHSSDRNDNFLKIQGNKLCLSCHADISRRSHAHPYGIPPKGDRQIRLDKEGNLICASCHEAHAGDEVKLLVKGGCAKCHG